MQAITDDLLARLKSHFQAGASGFRGRVEVDEILPATGTPDGYYPPMGSENSDATGNVMYGKSGHPTPQFATPFYGGSWYFFSGGGTTYFGGAVPAGFVDWPCGDSSNYANLAVIGPGTMTVHLRDQSGLNNRVVSWQLWRVESDMITRTGIGSGSINVPADTVIVVPNDGYLYHYVEISGALAYSQPPQNWIGFGGFTWVGAGSVLTHHYQAKRIAIDKSLRLVADQAEVEFANEDLALGWGASFLTNSRIRAYQWYGDPANEVLAFTGLIDRVGDTRDVLTATVTARDMMAILIDQTFGATAPQTAGETGAVRTMANGVYLSMEVSAIVADILDRAGWPAADRAITLTSYTLDEYIIADGTSWADAIIGADRLGGLVGYDAWADETGVFHFAPTFSAGALTDPGVPVYTYRTGEDVVSLADETDQYDLRTRVKIRGPLTSQTLTDTWRELWRTNKIRYPVGIWYDPSDSGNIRVLDRGTKRLYKLRQSDRKVLSSVYLGSVITYPLGISGDPSDATIYWVLNGPWLWGSGSVSQIVKVRKSDNHVLARYDLSTNHWSSIKVSGAYIYVADLSSDHIYRRSKTDGSAHDNFQHSYGGHAQTNPSGIMVDGTTISVFWSNAGTTARFLDCAESAPTVITKVVKTAGTVLVGGEMNTTTHTECWGGSDSLGLVAKFTLVAVGSITTEVYAEYPDAALEDELGALAQSEPRIHDAHSGDPAHAYEIRRDTVDVTAIISLAQAYETAGRRLDKLAHRRRVLDVGIIGNPALQKTDLVRVEDPVTGIAEDWLIDTYRSDMAADGTYLGTLALLPVVQPGDTPTDDGPATEDGGFG